MRWYSQSHVTHNVYSIALKLLVHVIGSPIVVIRIVAEHLTKFAREAFIRQTLIVLVGNYGKDLLSRLN